MAGRIRAKQIAPHHLAKDRLPLALIVFLADAIGRQRVMPAFADLGGIRAHHDVDQMVRAEPFLGPERR